MTNSIAVAVLSLRLAALPDPGKIRRIPVGFQCEAYPYASGFRFYTHAPDAVGLKSSTTQLSAFNGWDALLEGRTPCARADTASAFHENHLTDAKCPSPVSRPSSSAETTDSSDSPIDAPRILCARCV